MKRDREEKLRQAAGRAVGDSGSCASVPLQFHHSPKRYVGQDREIAVGVDGQCQTMPSSKLVQSAWNQLIKLTDAYRVRSRDRFTPGQMRHAIVTYPTVASPLVRREMERLVRELGMTTVQTDYDEAISAAIFYLMRDVGGIPDLGMEAFKARCRTDGRRWWHNVLVLDIGGGSTDVALIRLTLEEENPFAAGEDTGAGGRYYRIVPELVGSTGHLQLGGELVTLRTFELLKTAIADQLLTAAAEVPPGQCSAFPLGELKRQGASPPVEPEGLRPAASTGADLLRHLQGIISGLSERFRDCQDRFVSGSLLLHVLNRHGDGLDGGPAREALDIANQVLPTRWQNDPATLETFYELWEYAESAKLELGRPVESDTAETPTFTLNWSQVLKLLRTQPGVGSEDVGVGAETPVAAPGPEFAVTIDRKQFEWAIGPVIKEAISIARGLVKSRLENKPGERLDWLILSGKTCYLDLVHRQVRRHSGEGASSVWQPRQITFVPKYAKLATSVGACYAEYLRQYRFNPEGARQLLRKGFHQLHFDIRNLFFYLPCSFVREVVGGFETIFQAGDPMYQLDEESIGKVRSPWTQPTLTTGVHRQDFPLGSKIKWGSFSAGELLKFLGVTETRFINDYKLQFEVNQRLQFQLLLCKGMPHFQISDKLPSLSVQLTNPCVEHVGGDKEARRQGDKETEDSGSLSPCLPVSLSPSAGLSPGLQCDIAVKLGSTEEILFSRNSEWTETFHYEDGPIRRGRVSGPLPAFPVTGRHTLMVRYDDGWVSLGELARPEKEAEYPCQYRFSLDEQGSLRLHAGEPPYWETSQPAGVNDAGCVYRLELELFPTDVDVLRDPFSGVH